MKHFLLTYDIKAHRLCGFQRHEERDAHRAIADYEEAERVHRGDRSLEIVLVSAASLRTVRRTHERYFGGRGGERVSRHLSRLA